MLAEHVADAETYVITQGQGWTIHEWRPKPSKPDNHWLDCLVPGAPRSPRPWPA
jgi:hypothetical protein